MPDLPPEPGRDTSPSGLGASTMLMIASWIERARQVGYAEGKHDAISDAIRATEAFDADLSA